MLEDLARLRQRVAELEAALSRNSQGSDPPSANRTLIEEVGQRERVEAILEESEERYRAVFDALPMGVAVSDFDGNTVSCNRAVEALTGYTMKDLESIDVGNVYPDTRERDRLIAQLVKQGRVDDWECRLRRKDGSFFNALLNVRVLDLGGMRSLLTVVQDIAEHTCGDGRWRGSPDL